MPFLLSSLLSALSCVCVDSAALPLGTRSSVPGGRGCSWGSGQPGQGESLRA